MVNSNGMLPLLIQYFKNGRDEVARNLKYPLNKIKVVMFQLIINPPKAAPTIKELKKFTSPIYSGERNKESAPK